MRSLNAAGLVAAALAAPAALAVYGPVPFLTDPGFGAGGVSRAELPPEFTPQRILVTDGGSIYTLTAGEATAGEFTYYLTRRDAQGALDSGFGTGGALTHADSSVAGVQTYLGVCEDPATGAVYLAGATEGAEGVIVRRFVSDGSIDVSWGANGLLDVPMAGEPQPYAQGCAVQPDGKLVVVGSWSALDADARGLTNQAFVARLTTTGDLDADFGDAGVFAFVPGGRNLHHALTHVVRDLQGNLYVAGHSTDPRLLWRDLILAKLTPTGEFALPYANAGSLNLPLGPSDERVAGVRVNSGGRLVVALLHSPSDGSAGYAVTALRFTGRGDVDVTYGCAGVKSGPLRIGSLVPQAGAFNAEGSALFVARESGSSDYESVVRTSGLPELGAGGASGEEIAHGCPSNEVLTHNLGGGRMPLGLLALCAVAALRRGLRRR